MDNNIGKIQIQKEEVSEVKWVTKEEMELLIKEEKLIPHKEDYKFLREILK